MSNAKSICIQVRVNPRHECVFVFPPTFPSSLDSTSERPVGSSNSTDSSQKEVQYYYIPTEWICIAFVTLFGLSTSTAHSASSNVSLLTIVSRIVVHTAQAVRSRYWWLFPSAIFCGLLEVAGWSGRLWASQNPYIDPPVILQ